MLPFILVLETDSLTPKALAIAETSSALIAQAPASGQTPKNSKIFPYAAIQLGVGFPQNYSGSLDLAGMPINTTLNLKTGFNGEAAIGYQINQTRAELAVGYGNYGVSQQTFDGMAVANSGSVQTTTVMVNGYYDFPIYNRKGLESRWSPYIGVGLGYANITTPACDDGACFAGGSSNGFAYQGKAGVSYRLAQRNFAFLEGGYLGATSGTVDGVSFGSFNTWRLNVGLRFGFGG